MINKKITLKDAEKIGKSLNLNWVKFKIEEFRKGMEVEMEHGTRYSSTNVSNDDLLITGKIALAHLNEFPDYYKRLEKMESEAEKYWEQKIKPKKRNQRTEYIG